MEGAACPNLAVVMASKSAQAMAQAMALTMIDHKTLEDIIRKIPLGDNPRSTDGSATREDLEQQAKKDAEEDAKDEAQKAYDETYADVYEAAYQRILDELLDEHGFSD